MTPRESALIVPVFNAHAAFGAIRERLDPAAKRGIPTHVTVLYPFLAPDALDATVLSELRAVVAAHASFRFSLSRTAWFGDTVLWLAPEPDAPFRDLTDAVTARWPDHPPYGGRFADVVPHLTIGDGGPHEALRGAERTIAPALPIAAHASEVVLMSGSNEPRSWKALARFPLG